MKAMALQKKMHIYHWVCVCLCVCVCIHTNIYIYIYKVYVQVEEEGDCFTDPLSQRLRTPGLQ